MHSKARENLALAVAKAIWAEDGKVNDHSGKWEDLDRLYEDDLKEHFEMFAQAALEEIERQGWTLVGQ